MEKNERKTHICRMRHNLLLSVVHCDVASLQNKKENLIIVTNC